MEKERRERKEEGEKGRRRIGKLVFYVVLSDTKMLRQQLVG